MLLALTSSFGFFLLFTNSQSFRKKSSQGNFAIIDKSQGVVNCWYQHGKREEYKFLTDLVFVIEAPGSDDPVKLWTCVLNSQSSYFCPCLLHPYLKVACFALNRRKYFISIWAHHLGDCRDISGYCDVIDNQSEATKWEGYEMNNWRYYHHYFRIRCKS